MDGKFNLLVIAAGYPSATSYAGAFHRDQVQLMARAEFDVTVVVPTPWVPPGLAALRPGWRSLANSPVRDMDGAVTVLRPRYLTGPAETQKLWPDLAQYVGVALHRLPRPDIVQVFYGFPPGGAARRLARRWGVPYLVSMLGDDVNLYPSQQPRNLRVLTEVVRDAAWAFANGEMLAAEAGRITGFPVASLPIGVDAARFENLPSREEARALLGLPPDKKLALYVGSLLPAKGTAELIAALREVQGDGIVGVVIGDGPLRENLCGVENAIWLGVRSPSDVALAAVAADFLVHPSHSEGLSIAMLEAAFAGLPMITTDARGCIDLGRDGRALVVPVRDVAALAQAMRQAASGPVEMAQRAQHMLLHVRENYSLAANTQRLIDKYREILSRKRVVGK